MVFINVFDEFLYDDWLYCCDMNELPRNLSELLWGCGFYNLFDEFRYYWCFDWWEQGVSREIFLSSPGVESFEVLS